MPGPECHGQNNHARVPWLQSFEPASEEGGKSPREIGLVIPSGLQGYAEQVFGVGLGWVWGVQAHPNTF